MLLIRSTMRLAKFSSLLPSRQALAVQTVRLADAAGLQVSELAPWEQVFVLKAEAL
jgi:hypothetical protein